MVWMNTNIRLVAELGGNHCVPKTIAYFIKVSTKYHALVWVQSTTRGGGGGGGQIPTHTHYNTECE